MRRIVTFILPFLLCIGCTQRYTPPPDTLVVAIGASPATLDPRRATDAYGVRMADLLFHSLVTIGSDLQVQGDAAESWTYKDKKYLFKIKKDLKFSNGDLITPEDIEFSFQEFQKKSNPYNSSLVNIKKVKSFSQGRQIFVEVALHEPSGKLLISDLPVVKILPRSVVQKYENNFHENLVGSGSFKFVSQTANEIVLARNKHNSDRPPKIENLVFKIIRDDFTRFQKMYKGSLDITQSEIPLSKVIIFERKSDEFQVYKYPGLSMSYLLINLTDENLKNRKLRLAMAHALNVDEIITYKLEGLADRATSLLSPVNPFFNKSLKAIPYLPDKAKSMLRDLGLENTPFILKTSNSLSAVENGKVIVNQLRALGLNIKQQSYEWGTYYGDIKKGNFQLATMRWVGILDPDIYRMAFHSSEYPPGRNRGRYKNPVIDRLTMSGLAIENMKDRVQHYKEVQKIVYQDLPIIPLWYDHQVAIVNRRVNNYKPSKSGDYRSFINVTKQSNEK